MNRWRPWRKRLLWVAASLLGLWLLLWAGMYGLMHLWVARPPAVEGSPPITLLAPEARPDGVYLGRNRLVRREGLPVLYLSGSPFEIGYANGVLTRELIRRQEDALLTLLQRVAPFQWTRFVLKFIVVYRNRALPAHVLPEYQTEIYGLSRGCPDPHPELGPFFHRLLNYHAAQDISYMMMHSPLLHRGCTAFGAWGANTRDGHLLTGRNFDWEADPVFDQDRLLVYCEPERGIPFVSLAWSGMVGCVSGMNREGLSITINGAPSHIPSDAATPTCLVAREVLQYARNIAEARAIIEKRAVFVSALFLVGSRQDGRFVVIEKTPTACAVREPDAEPRLVCANHYLTAALAADPINQEFLRAETSQSRYDRLTELLSAKAPVDAPAIAAILRDRRLPGGQPAGNGHRGSLNPLIATHSVIMDLTAGLFWAARPPHQLGRFVAFDLNAPERELPTLTIPEDPFLSSGEFTRYQAAMAALDSGWQALKKGRLDSALASARQAETNNPGFYQNAWLLADTLLRQGQVEAAAGACRAAMAGRPALESERAKLGELAREIARRNPQPGHP